MFRVEWSDEAQLDLVEVRFYIAKYNQAAADALACAIEYTAEHQLPLMPYVFCKDKVVGTRECVVHPNYIMVYKISSSSTLKVFQ